jgi:translocation and assembly module TamB
VSRLGKSLRGLAALALGFLLLAAGGLLWVAATRGGSRWTLATLASQAGITYSARTVEGRLGRLRLEGIRISVARLEVAIDRAEIDWGLQVLRQEIRIHTLTLRGVRIQDNTPLDRNPPPILWPRVPPAAARLKALLEHLEVTDLSYRRLGDPPVIITRLRASALWEHARLSTQNLDLAAPQGRISGSLAAGLGDQSLLTDLVLVPGKPLGSVDRALLQVRLQKGRLEAGRSRADLLAGSVQASLEAKGKPVAELRGLLNLADTGLRFQIQQGLYLAGALQGSLDLDFQKGWQAACTGRNLDPAGLDPAWKGILNFDLQGNGQGERTEVQAILLKSRLHGQALEGKVSILREGEDLAIRSLFLRGRGFDLSAAGNLSQRIAVQAHVQDLALLVPGTRGSLQIQGWVRRAGSSFAGELTGQGRGLEGAGGHLAALTIQARFTDRLALDLSLNDLSVGRFQAQSVTMKATGTLAQHAFQAALSARAAQVNLALSGGYAQGTWTGSLVSLSGRDPLGPWTLDAPVALAVAPGRLQMGALRLRGTGSERLEGAAMLTFAPLRGTGSATLTQLNLARLRPWVAGLDLQGAVSGTVATTFLEAGRLALAAKLEAHGSLTAAGRAWVLETARLDLVGNDAGLKGSVGIRLAGGGALDGSLSAPGPMRLALPAGGALDLTWRDLDPAWARPWMPEGLAVQGRFGGKAQAKVQGDRTFTVAGTAELAQGQVRGRSTEGEVTVVLGRTTLAWNWSGATLQGQLDLALADHGFLKSSFSLPVAARLPLGMDGNGSLQGTLKGRLQEKGLLGAHLPALAQETLGDLDVDLQLQGTPRAPALAGRVALSGAGAFLPSAGIQVRDVRFTALLEKDLIRIQDLHLASGSGALNGAAEFHLQGSKLVSWKGTLEGKDFQAVAFPELDVLASPTLTFAGSPGRLQVRGEVLLPRMKVEGPLNHGMQTPSPDVRVVGRTVVAARPFPLVLDAQIRLRFGDHVLVATEQIDARLGGDLLLIFSDPAEIRSQGEIHIVQGRFHTYGVALDITRGRLFYASGPLGEPTMDVLAVRQVGEVRAGVTVSGPLTAPTTALYSDPAMPDEDKLSYIVLGHALGATSGAGLDLMGQAASVLISKGQSAVLQDRIKTRLGLSTLDIRTTAGDDPALMGYKPMVASTASVRSENAAADAMMTLGKFLTPRLYVSYGRSLFTGGNLFLLRFDLDRHWQMEALTGTESGVDLFYKLEFR